MAVRLSALRAEHFYPKNIPDTSFLLDAESTPGP
jgi:hypothetical protein